MQDQAFGELEKNSDKLQRGTSSSDSSQPAHLHQLLCSLQKQLLAYCHINSVTEVRRVSGLQHQSCEASDLLPVSCLTLVPTEYFSLGCKNLKFHK